jgi:branched-chain amino acid transport system ATP-binding protein
MTVLENWEMGAFTRQITDTRWQMTDILHRVFYLFTILKERKKQRAGTLSSGEQ